MPRPLPLSLLLAAALAGCTEAETGRHYPSLLPRPIESTSLAEPERAVPVAAPDPALDKRIAELSAMLDKAAADYTSAAQSAEARIAVARGLPQGSEAWLDAQAALSQVDAARAPVASTLAELEQLAIERGQSGQPPYPALEAAVARAGTLAETQGTRSAALEAAIAGQ